MKRRIISWCLILVLMLSVVATPALAAGTPRGNGYEGFSVVYNGKSYSVSLSTRYVKESGARTQVYTEAAVYVVLDPTHVKYQTYSYGYWEGQNLTTTEARLTGSNHLLATPYVQCPYGYTQVINFVYISGGVTITSDGQLYASTVYGTP